MAAPRKRVVKPKSFPEIVAAGDRVVTLRALRDELAKRLEAADRDVPAMARQLMAVLRELDELNPPASESKLDDLANRRAARLANAKGQ